jgi:hypothetical protein
MGPVRVATRVLSGVGSHAALLVGRDRPIELGGVGKSLSGVVVALAVGHGRWVFLRVSLGGGRATGRATGRAAIGARSELHMPRCIAVGLSVTAASSSASSCGCLGLPQRGLPDGLPEGKGVEVQRCQRLCRLLQRGPERRLCIRDRRVVVICGRGGPWSRESGGRIPRRRPVFSGETFVRADVRAEVRRP